MNIAYQLKIVLGCFFFVNAEVCAIYVNHSYNVEAAKIAIEALLMLIL